MITYFNGTVFNAKADTIVNTVNCIGVMGAGLALEFGLRYPWMLDQYKSDCANKLYTPGCVKYYKNNDITIVNFATKWHFKYPSKIEWIKIGLQNFLNSYKQHNIQKIAFPKLGTFNGGLDWNIIQPIMERYLSTIDDLEIIICLDNNPYAEGDELLMINFLKENCEYILNNISKINSKQKQILVNKIPYINHFWELSKLDGIGITTYTKLFNYCYDHINKSFYTQISIFD